MIYGILIFLDILVSILLVIVILLQSGRGGGLAGTLGGGISTAMFGGQGADKLMTRLTTGLAAAFMILAILISIAGRPRGTMGDSIVRQRAIEQETVPLQPVTEMEMPEAASPVELPLPPEDDQSSPIP
ncbi:MAG: preprotein translocase subunit SecG [Fidelibacterota bacterium]|nr:MAG: preprotein translocase subunit SecG [Candidatus Neomarinimicrobiota bacterium]